MDDIKMYLTVLGMEYLRYLFEILLYSPQNIVDPGPS